MQVLAEGDPYIPANDERPLPGAIPVRFFGTYDFSWIDSVDRLAPFAATFDHHAHGRRDASFTTARSEAQQFLVRKCCPAFAVVRISHTLIRCSLRPILA